MRPNTGIKILLGLFAVATVSVLFVINRQPVTLTPKESPWIEEQPKNSSHKKYVVFHMDLKGAPPKLSFILDILTLAKKAGATGVLMEYEDTFPWSGFLRNISAGNAFSKSEVEAILNKANELGLEVIPLIQTFGHLEFVLKLSEFRHLRELDSFPQEVCPAKPESFKIIKEMIRQTMELHKRSRYLHIGCDEVYHLAACPVCSRKNPRAIFTSHVRKVANHIKSRYPGVQPLIWDDMLRKWPPSEIEESQLGQYVEPMVWVYIEDIQRLVPHFIWYIYKKTFRNIWGASAFKGAFGEQEVIPNLYRHMENNMAWQRLISPPHPDQAVMHQDDFSGIVITGWSRYDHFAVLSELLPAAIPSLVLSLTLAINYNQHYEDEVMEQAAVNKMLSIINCPESKLRLGDLKRDRFPWIFGECKYPGSEIYRLAREYVVLQARWETVKAERRKSGWVTKYNMQHHYSSPYRILELFQEEGFAAQRLLSDVQKLKTDVRTGFVKFYNHSIVEEWIEQKLVPIQNDLIKMAESFQSQLEVKSWPRRPVP